MKTSKIKRPAREVLEKLKQLEPTHKGMVAAIESDTGKYFLGKTVLEAYEKAHRRYPKSLFYFVRIGYPAVDWHRGGLRMAEFGCGVKK